MDVLSGKSCEPCRAGAPLASREEIAEYMQELTGWKIVETDGIKKLEKCYQFKNFIQALDFSNRVGALAEQEHHHPAILTEWGKVTVTWWTHKIGGLHGNDFIMAAKTDAVDRPGK